MFKEQMNKIKSLIVKKPENGEEIDKTKKRKIENLVVFLVILIITLIVINAILGGNSKQESKEEEQGAFKVLAEKENKNKTDNELEEKLENILTTMVGVRQGKCISNIYPVQRSCSNV